MLFKIHEEENKQNVLFFYGDEGAYVQSLTVAVDEHVQ
jgi:hypothetical protein